MPAQPVQQAGPSAGGQSSTASALPGMAAGDSNGGGASFQAGTGGSGNPPSDQGSNSSLLQAPHSPQSNQVSTGDFAAALGGQLSQPVAPAGGTGFAAMLAGAGGTTPTVQAGPQMAQQMVNVLSGLTAGPNGTHSLVIQMQPDGLGVVRAAVTTSPGNVSVHLSAQTNEGFDALNKSLPQLQTLLSNGGSFGANVHLSRQQDWQGNSGSGNSSGRGTAGADEEEAVGAATGATRTGTMTDHSIDIHI